MAKREGHRALGIYQGKKAPPTSEFLKTDEGLSGVPESISRKRRETRRFRYRLQGVAKARELARERRKHGAGDWVAEGWKPSGRAKCQTTPHGPVVALVRVKGGGVAIRGVGRCGSIAECPVCQSVESFKRAVLVRTAVKRFERDGGGRVLFITVTTRHDYTDGLRDLSRAVCGSWTDVWSNKVGKTAKIRWKIEGSIRGFDVTHGVNGWHPHLHVLLFTRHRFTKQDREQLRAWVWRRWMAAITKRGFPAPEESVAVKVQPVVDRNGKTAAYITKMGLASEVTQPAVKHGREGNRNQWQVLRDYAEHGRARDAMVWDDYCEGIRGTRWLYWSKGLKLTWTGQANDEPAQVEETLVELSSDELRGVDSYMMPAILEAADRGDPVEPLLPYHNGLGG